MFGDEGELRKWREIIEIGENRTSLELSNLQRNHLTSVFAKMHNKEETFLEKMYSVKVMHMQHYAENEEGQTRITALVDVGDACLIKAGFPKIISKHARKFFKNPCTLAMRVGRQCYESLSMSTWSIRKNTEGWSELALGFDEMVEVMWASQENGYPELEELMDMALVAEARCAIRTIKRIHNSIPLHVRGL